MGETGKDLPPLDLNPGQASRESALSGEETLNLVSRLRAGNNSRSSDIVRPNFKNVRPISHFDRT